MDIMESQLADDINDVLNSGAKNSDAYWRAELLANGKTIEIIKVLMIDTLQDFEQNFADETIIQCVIGQGTYTYQVYPYLDNLEIILYKQPLTEVAGNPDPDAVVKTQRYRATLIAPRTPVVTSNQVDETAMNLRDLETLRFQLQDFYLEQLFTLTMGTVFRKSTLGELTRHVLTMGIDLPKVADKYRPTGVEMVEAANTVMREQTVIPHGTPLVQVPQYLHQMCGGIYPTGFSYYLCNKLWYVFPSYDTTRFKKSQKTLTVVRVPSNRMPNVERTYMENGNNLKILVTGETSTANNSESLILNNGNGVRFTDASKIVEGFATVKDNKATAPRGDNNNEIASITRQTGVTNAAVTGITTNQMVEYSRLAARDGSVLLMEWENSEPDLLIPGMPVKVLYLEEGNVREVMGVLLKAHSYTGLRGVGLTSARHSTSTALAIFVSRKYQYTD